MVKKLGSKVLYYGVTDEDPASEWPWGVGRCLSSRHIQFDEVRVDSSTPMAMWATLVAYGNSVSIVFPIHRAYPFV